MQVGIEIMPMHKLIGDSSKYASWYRNNAYAQIDWGLSYIKSRYGTPSAAWNKSRASGWY